MSKPVTLIDVARHAGVSRSTASLVLQQSPLVADKTRARVEASMTELGYVYNRAAANLRAGRSRTIGLAVTDITNPFFAELAVEIEARTEDESLSVLMANTGDRADRQTRWLTKLLGYQIDGLVLCPAQGTEASSLENLQRQGVPVVLVARNIRDSGADYVGVNNRMGAQMATRHLLAGGHTSIAFIGGPSTSSARKERESGYMKAMHEAGLQDASLSVDSPVSSVGGFDAIRSLMQRTSRPTAAVCYNDVVAFGVLRGLQSLEIQPGSGFGLIGFDNVADAELVRPGLTTVAVPTGELASQAVSFLLERIDGYSGKPRRKSLRPSLIVRQSA